MNLRFEESIWVIFVCALKLNSYRVIFHDLFNLRMSKLDEFNPRVFLQSFQNIFIAY